MKNRRFPQDTGRALALVAVCLTASLPAQNRRRAPAGQPPFDPQAMMERFFGADTEEDRQALAKIQVSVQEERQMGEAAVQAFLADLKRQGIRVVSRGKEVQYLRDLVETIRPLMANGMTMMRIWSRPFRPEDEAVADSDGARWAYRAGYDPRELARLIRVMGQKRAAVPLPMFLQSHPDPDRRAKAVLELYDELQNRDPKDNLYLGKENLKRRVARSQKRFEE